MRKTFPRAACAAALSGFNSRAQIEVRAGFGEIAALAEQGAEQVMRIGIARIVLQRLAVVALPPVVSPACCNR